MICSLYEWIFSHLNFFVIIRKLWETWEATIDETRCRKKWESTRHSAMKNISTRHSHALQKHGSQRISFRPESIYCRWRNEKENVDLHSHWCGTSILDTFVRETTKITLTCVVFIFANLLWKSRENFGNRSFVDQFFAPTNIIFNVKYARRHSNYFTFCFTRCPKNLETTCNRITKHGISVEYSHSFMPKIDEQWWRCDHAV